MAPMSLHMLLARFLPQTYFSLSSKRLQLPLSSSAFPCSLHLLSTSAAPSLQEAHLSVSLARAGSKIQTCHSAAVNHNMFYRFRNRWNRQFTQWWAIITFTWNTSYFHVLLTCNQCRKEIISCGVLSPIHATPHSSFSCIFPFFFYQYKGQFPVVCSYQIHVQSQQPFLFFWRINCIWLMQEAISRCMPSSNSHIHFPFLM